MFSHRRGTRVSCEIPITLTRLDAVHLFSEPCVLILVNPQGCAARFALPLTVGAAVQLEGLPVKRKVTARVVNCFWPGEFAKFWVLGLALDEPGNVWGIETPPEDWHTRPTPPSGTAKDLASTKSTPSARPLILCLEDNESYMRLRKAVLEKNGYRVIGVSTVKDALGTLREAPVCLVISDHMLRGTTGTDFVSEMKHIKPDVPVVLYSGKQPDALENVDVFINKDVSTQDSLVLVRDVVKRYSS